MSLDYATHLNGGQNTSSDQVFHPFTRLPAELRARIWQLAIVPHIVRWVRIDDNATPFSSSFPSLPHRDIVFHVCHEAREAVSLSAKYVSLGVSEEAVYSPAIDYLHLDPAWRKLRKDQLRNDPFNSLPFDFKLIRKVMINPNYTDNRMKPGVALERLPLLRQVLVVADEKSVGLNGKFMMASVYDLKKYYEAAKHRDPAIKIPYIAVGCLGWVGEDRTQISHRSEDKRELVAIFETHAELKEHLVKMRDEEKAFLQSTFSGNRTGFKLKFKPGYSMEGPVTQNISTTSALNKGSLGDSETTLDAHQAWPPTRRDTGESPTAISGSDDHVPATPPSTSPPTYAQTLLTDNNWI